MTKLVIYIPEQQVGALLAIAKRKNLSPSKIMSQCIDDMERQIIKEKKAEEEAKCQYTIPGYSAQPAQS